MPFKSLLERDIPLTKGKHCKTHIESKCIISYKQYMFNMTKCGKTGGFLGSVYCKKNLCILDSVAVVVCFFIG